MSRLAHYLSDCHRQVLRVREDIASILPPTATPDQAGPPSQLVRLDSDPLYCALIRESETLAASYQQIRNDLSDSSRTSWAGTAHEIREIVSTLLRIKAPDAEVQEQQWFRQEKNTTGPTQKQRVRYILQQHGGGSKQQDVVEGINIIEEKVGELVRATYSRASDAAHRMKGRTEAKRLLRYFEAFTHDLLNLD